MPFVTDLDDSILLVEILRHFGISVFRTGKRKWSARIPEQKLAISIPCVEASELARSYATSGKHIVSDFITTNSALTVFSLSMIVFNQLIRDNVRNSTNSFVFDISLNSFAARMQFPAANGRLPTPFSLELAYITSNFAEYAFQFNFRQVLPWRDFHYYSASFASVFASTRTPFSICSGEENSSGR